MVTGKRPGFYLGCDTWYQGRIWSTDLSGLAKCPSQGVSLEFVSCSVTLCEVTRTLQLIRNGFKDKKQKANKYSFGLLEKVDSAVRQQ